jgi:hypothetical protein
MTKSKHPPKHTMTFDEAVGLIRYQTRWDHEHSNPCYMLDAKVLNSDSEVRLELNFFGALTLNRSREDWEAKSLKELHGLVVNFADKLRDLVTHLDEVEEKIG